MQQTSDLPQLKTTAQAPFKGRKVCMVAPYFPKVGGMTVQVQMMVDALEGEGATVLRVDTILHALDRKPLFPLRILLQPIVTAAKFLLQAPKSDVVHIHASSWWGFVPVMVCAPLNRIFTRKHLVISFHGGAGHVWLTRYSRLVKPFLRMSERIAVVSPKLQAAFAEHGFETTFLRNLVNLDRFPYLHRTQSRNRIVWIRKFDDVYNPIGALKVFQMVKRELPDATITFIGDGPLRPDMENFIKEHALEGVKFAGRLPNEAVHTEFEAADILLNTSVNDGLPTALLEAAASGLPIVSTDPGGIPSVVETGVSGVLLPVGDTDGLAREVIVLLRDPDMIARMSAEARANAERYSWSECRKHLAVLYGFCEEAPCFARCS